MAYEDAYKANEILGIDKVTKETRRIRTNNDGELIISSADLSAILSTLQGTLTTTLTGPDGTPISSASGKLDVRASELETLLTALGAKDFATQTTLAQILAKIIPAPATEAKQDALIAKDFATETTLGAGIVSLLSAIAENASETTTAAILAKLEAGIDTTLSGSKVCLSTETKPAGVQGDTLLEYNATTKETKVYKYITGQWREI